MRSALTVCLALLATSASAQSAALPTFSGYPAGPVYRGRVAPLVESSSPTARTFRTRTREAMAEGVNFAGHYVIATWGCGTGCIGGHIVDARTGRSVADLPFNTPYVTYELDSRLLRADSQVFATGEESSGQSEGVAPDAYESSYWMLDRGALTFVGSFVTSGDVLVPLASGNTWTYTTDDGGTTVTYRIVGPETETNEYGDTLLGFAVERIARGPRGERRTSEVWNGGGSFVAEPAGGEMRVFSYEYGVPETLGETERIERTTVYIGAASHEAICYVTDAASTEGGTAIDASRTCFVPRIGMVSDDRDGAMTLTSYTLR